MAQVFQYLLILFRIGVACVGATVPSEISSPAASDCEKLPAVFARMWLKWRLMWKPLRSLLLSYRVEKSGNFNCRTWKNQKRMTAFRKILTKAMNLDRHLCLLLWPAATAWGSKGAGFESQLLTIEACWVITLEDNGRQGVLNKSFVLVAGWSLATSPWTAWSALWRSTWPAWRPCTAGIGRSWTRPDGLWRRAKRRWRARNAACPNSSRTRDSSRSWRRTRPTSSSAWTKRWGPDFWGNLFASVIRILIFRRETGVEGGNKVKSLLVVSIIIEPRYSDRVRCRGYPVMNEEKLKNHS